MTKINDSSLKLDTSNFDNSLDSGDDTLQKALDKLDDVVAVVEGIPTGAIIIWTGVSCPVGWVRDTTLDNLYLKGAAPASSPSLTPVGNNTHTHSMSHNHTIGSHTHTITDLSGVDFGDGTGDIMTGTGGTRDPHSHTGITDASTGNTGTYSGLTGSTSNEPQHVTVLFCRKT